MSVWLRALKLLKEDFAFLFTQNVSYLDRATLLRLFLYIALLTFGVRAFWIFPRSLDVIPKSKSNQEEWKGNFFRDTEQKSQNKSEQGKEKKFRSNTIL